MLDYRPSDKQRTMLELMQYLGHIFATGVAVNIAGGVGYKELSEEAPVVTLENFDEVMKQQADFVKEQIDGLTDDELVQSFTVFGRTATLAEHLHAVMKWTVAYKMQLFLYIKANGNHHLSTMNLWAGVDAAPIA